MTASMVWLSQARSEARRNLADLPDPVGEIPAIRYAGLSLPHGWRAIRQGPNGTETALCPDLTRAAAYVFAPDR